LFICSLCLFLSSLCLASSSRSTLDILACILTSRSSLYRSIICFCAYQVRGQSLSSSSPPPGLPGISVPLSRLPRPSSCQEINNAGMPAGSNHDDYDDHQSTAPGRPFSLNPPLNRPHSRNFHLQQQEVASTSAAAAPQGTQWRCAGAGDEPGSKIPRQLLRGLPWQPPMWFQEVLCP